MERVEIIILDMNKKNELLNKREKKELLNYANLIITGSNIEIIEPMEEYIQRLKKMYENNYPIDKKIRCKELNIENLSKNFQFNNGHMIILPYFNNTKHWIKLVIGEKEKFLSYMLENGYFNSFSMICLSEKVIYDIEFGEQEYEIRICEY